MSSVLFSPIRLAELTLSSRIAVSPMCQYSANDGCASDWHLTHLGMLANSGAGLVVVEATAVERRGRITHGCLGLYSEACETALARVVAHCKRIGTAALGIQLAHAGRKASARRPWEGGQPLTAADDAWETIGPSSIPFGPGWPAPREMTREDLTQVREAFATAARRAVRIGFDAVEMHMAHGYLLHTFLSPLSNARFDEYGGSLAARMRFPLEVAAAVREAMPPAVPLGARITGSDWMEAGLTVADAVAYAKALKNVGVDYVCVSSGGIAADTRKPSRSSPPAQPIWSRSPVPSSTIRIGPGRPHACSGRMSSARRSTLVRRLRCGRAQPSAMASRPPTPPTMKGSIARRQCCARDGTAATNA
jgi:NADPH2 dehydrogenase